ADTVDGARDVDRAAARSALEQQVLQEVADTGQAVGFVPSSHPDPHADRDGARRTHRLDGHGQAGGELDDVLGHSGVGARCAPLPFDSVTECRSAMTATTTTATVAIAPVTAVTAVAGVAPITGGTEVTDLARELGVEAVLERHRLDRVVAGAGGTDGHRGGLADLTVAGVGAAVRLGQIAGRHEADLAAVVDLLDRDLDLVAERDDVLDRVDPLAAAELGDVHQAVAAGEDVDEGAELGDVHDAAGVGAADLGLRRVDDRHD